jgi:proline dehydrogenase
MLPNFLIYLSKAKWAQEMITRWGIARRAARRFVAGETTQEAIAAARMLNHVGIDVTLDHLGENTTNQGDAVRSAEEVMSMLDQIQAEKLRANVSIKLSQIGLLVDHQVFTSNLKKILEHAADCGIFIRLDMEDSSLTERTLQAYEWARDSGFSNLGVVIQAYLYRSEQDLDRLAARCTRVRLCKGAYREPASVAFPQKKDVDENFDRLMEQLLETSQACDFPRASEDGRTPPIVALATHDLQRIAFAKDLMNRKSIPRDAVEFQMLYGIRRDLQEALVKEGYRMRVYVPYGNRWYPYFMRRLAERPANIWFFLSNFVKG